jgi:hypothetical protein
MSEGEKSSVNVNRRYSTVYLTWTCLPETVWIKDGVRLGGTHST